MDVASEHLGLVVAGAGQSVDGQPGSPALFPRLGFVSNVILSVTAILLGSWDFIVFYLFALLLTYLVALLLWLWRADLQSLLRPCRIFSVTMGRIFSCGM